MDGEVRPVEQRQEGVRRRRLVVGVEELLRLLEALLRALGLRVAARLDQVEVRRLDQEALGRLGRDPLRDELVRLRPVGQAVLLLLGSRLALGVVERPLVEGHDALPGLLDHLLAELDRLREDDLFLGGQQGDLADLLEVHPDRVIDADHVGADGLEVFGGRLFDLGRTELRRRIGRQLGAVRRRIVLDDHGDVAALIGGLGTQVQVVVIVIVVVVRDGHGRLRPRRGAGRRAWPLPSRPCHGAAGTGRLRRVACLGGQRAWVTSDG